MLEDTLKRMKKAQTFLANASNDLKNRALGAVAEILDKNRDNILKENRLDLENAARENLPDPIIKRLKFDNQKMDVVIDGIRGLMRLEDPANKVIFKRELDEGLILTRLSVPIGVIGVIFESRPDALVQIATLCIKSGNGAILKGGREAAHTNRILADLIVKAVTGVDKLFADTVFLIETREDVAEIITFNKYISLIIPRGSNEFVQYIQKNSTIPVLGHADGICHVYFDRTLDIDKAVKIAVDSKTQYVSVCNAAETFLVHKEIAGQLLPVLNKALKAKGVNVKGCARTKKIIGDIEDAVEKDWKTEYLDYIISIKIVDTIDDAIDHINTYGSGHTDAIITLDNGSARKFRELVDTANVMVNCSTRFSDGYRYGFGAEVGVSTNKIHARGPVGLDGLVIYKYIVEGDSHIVADYTGEHPKKFTHKDIQ